MTPPVIGQDLWTAVDRYVSGLLSPHDPALDAALKASAAAGLPEIQVSTNLGKLLHLLARIRGARAILEIGTLGGYSTIWMARALPKDGRLITLELDQDRKSTRLNSSHRCISYAVFCLKKKNTTSE